MSEDERHFAGLFRSIDERRAELESAVVEAAIKFRKAETAAWVESKVGTEESAAQAKKEQPRAYLALLIAADALIKAREESK